VRERSGGDKGARSVDGFIASALEEISNKGKATVSA
jgi:hypothetical protein